MADGAQKKKRYSSLLAPGRSFKWMIYTVVCKECDTDTYHLTYDIVNDSKIHFDT